MTLLRHASFVLLVVVALCIARSAPAHDFCVSSAAQLQAALAAASDGGAYGGEDNEILVVKGVYKTGADTGNGAFSYASTGRHAIAISGGYSSGCASGGASQAASATILDGGHFSAVLVLSSPHGAIFLNGFTLRNGESVESGAGLRVNSDDLNAVDAFVGLSRLIVRDNHSSRQGGGLFVAAGTSLNFDTSLVVGNSSDSRFGAGWVTSGEGTHVDNLTVTRNASSYPPSPIGGLAFANETTHTVTNSIFWNNTSAGFFFAAGGNAYIYYSDYGAIDGTAPVHAVHDLSVKPQFVAPGDDDFHLAGNSPLLGFGVHTVSVTDLDGRPYPSDGRVDIGAYAETIFMDGFDGD